MRPSSARRAITFAQAKEKLIYDPEGRDVMQAFIDLGYGDTPMQELGVQ